MLQELFQDNLLVQALVYILSGGGAMALAYLAMENIQYLKDLENPWYKRLASYAISSVLGIAAYLFLMWLGAEPTPGTAQEWVSSLFAAALLASGGSQLIHGYKKLPRSK